MFPQIWVFCLESSKIIPEKAVLLMYAFVMDMPYDLAIRETSLYSETTSRETISDWYSYCQEVCVISLDTKYRNEGKFGGPGEIIEVDEIKFGRRKYNCGRYIEGKWIIGMIDISNDDFRYLEICPGKSCGLQKLRHFVICD